MKHILKKNTLFLYLVILCLIIFACSTIDENIGSAAYDPNAQQLGNLLISIDPEIWDCENPDEYVLFATGSFPETKVKDFYLNKELPDVNQRVLPCISLREDDFTGKYSFEEIQNKIDEYAAENMDSCTFYSMEEIYVEGYAARLNIIITDSGFYSHSLYIKDSAKMYTVTYVTSEDLYQDYLDSVQTALDSIHIR